MAALELETNTVKQLKGSTIPKGFYSVEFSIDKPRPLYQFKIWRSDSNPLFMLVKKSSNLLPKLKTGSILNMTYYSTDTSHPKKSMDTRIGFITNKQNGRFQGHCTIDLVPVCQTNLAN